MNSIKLNLGALAGFVDGNALLNYKEDVVRCQKMLHDGSGKGSDFLGWLNLPNEINEAQLSDLEATAAKLKAICEVVVVVGIGGSYLGTKAVCEALANSFDWLQTERKNPVLLYAGQNIGEDYTAELVELLKTKSFGIVVISKSGTTTEPALAFRILKELLESKVGKAAASERIVAITDEKRGALRTLATQEGYKTFVIPDNVGGRFSVLTPVGLLPIAVAGFDIRALVKGAVDMLQFVSEDVPYEQNIAAQYAAARNLLYQGGKKIEILLNYNPKLHYVSEWWKQLYGESEGKDNLGIFPASVDNTSDLHSMGQWIQEGERTIFETVISITEANATVVVPVDAENLDGLNFLAGKRVGEVNKKAEQGTRLAHIDGGVPNIAIELPKLNEYYLGQLIYFFEKACGISGYLLGVNPFDQPGVEAYKKNMFALLEKPGFEAETAALKARL